MRQKPMSDARAWCTNHGDGRYNTWADLGSPGGSGSLRQAAVQLRKGCRSDHAPGLRQKAGLLSQLLAKAPGAPTAA